MRILKEFVTEWYSRWTVNQISCMWISCLWIVVLTFFPINAWKKLPEPWHLSIMRESRGVSNFSSFVRFPSHSGCPKRVFAGLLFDQEQREHTWTKVFTSVGCLSRHSVIIKKKQNKKIRTHCDCLPKKKRQYSAFQSSYLVRTNLGS